MEKSNRMKDIVMTGATVLFLIWVIFGEKLCGKDVYYLANGVFLSCLGIAIILSEFLIQFIQFELKKAYGKGLKLKQKIHLSFEYLEEKELGRTRKTQIAVVLMIGVTYALAVDIAILGVLAGLFQCYLIFNLLNVFVMIGLLGCLAVYNILNITAYLAVKEMQEEECTE